MRSIRVRLQTAPHGLLRVVSPTDEVSYLAVGAGVRALPVWQKDGLAVYLNAGLGGDGGLVIDLTVADRPPDEEAAAA